MAREFLETDPFTGVSTFHEYVPSTDTTIIHYEQDVESLLDANKAAQTDGLNRNSELWHAASIPSIVILKWMTEHGVDIYNSNHKAGVRRLLNSSEYRHLRRAPFQI